MTSAWTAMTDVWRGRAREGTVLTTLALLLVFGAVHAGAVRPWALSELRHAAEVGDCERGAAVARSWPRSGVARKSRAPRSTRVFARSRRVLIDLPAPRAPDRDC